MVREAALVAQRCMEAQESGFADLSDCGLMSIPDAMYLFLKNTVVTKCDLSNNQLKRIPAKIGKEFLQMKEFNCSNNSGITTIPNEFCALENLHNLNLSRNKFTSIPLVPGSLKVLDLSNNCLGNITQEDIERLYNLDHIDLAGNNLNEESKYRLKSYANFTL